MPSTHLTNTQRKVVRKYLSRKHQLKEKIPFTKLIQLQLFQGIEIQHLKKLFKNEEMCMQDEERRTKVKMKQVQVQDKNSPYEGTGQVQDKKPPEKQVDQEPFQKLVIEVLQKDKELKESNEQLKESQRVIEKQRLRIKEIHSRCVQSYKMNNQIEREKHMLEKYFLRAEKEREYFKNCTKELQYEYAQLYTRVRRENGNHARDYWELTSQLKSCRLRLDSFSFTTSIEQEVKTTVDLLCEMNPQARVRKFMTMAEMRELIIREGTKLKEQNLIPEFYGDMMFSRAEEYWSIRNKMAHRHSYINEMDHKKFQADADWIFRQLRAFQYELQRLLKQDKIQYI